MPPSFAITSTEYKTALEFWGYQYYIVKSETMNHNILRRSMKKVLFLSILMLLSACVVTADEDSSRRFCLGWIMSAEISSKPVNVWNLDTFAFKDKFKDKAYAVVAVKLDRDRTLSIYDFSMVVDGSKFPCVALRKGISDFNASNWQFTDTLAEEVYSMLFIVEYPDLYSAKKIKLKLAYNLSSAGPVDYLIPFKNLNYGDFTPATNIPSDGALEVEPPPAAAAAPAPVTGGTNTGKK